MGGLAGGVCAGFEPEEPPRHNVALSGSRDGIHARLLVGVDSLHAEELVATHGIIWLQGAQAIVYAILKHENQWGATSRSMSETHKAGRRARRDLAVLLRTTLESDELAAWLQGLDQEVLPDPPKRPTIMQALLFRLPDTRKRYAGISLAPMHMASSDLLNVLGNAQATP